MYAVAGDEFTTIGQASQVGVQRRQMKATIKICLPSGDRLVLDENMTENLRRIAVFIYLHSTLA